MLAIQSNCMPIVRACHAIACNASKQARIAISKSKDSPKNAINTTHACTHLGGRGCACAPAFFLYYYHPPHNFFCNIAPFMGRCLHMVIMGCKSHATHPPSPPHSMASDRGYVFVVWKEGVLGFYVVTKQAMH